MRDPIRLLEHRAFGRLRLLAVESGARGGLEDLAHALLSLSRALQIGIGADTIGHGTALVAAHRLLAQFHELALRLLVVAQVAFVAH